jgi:ketosteroid isomerase-like protein
MHDVERVMAVFALDAVVLAPHHPPAIGKSAIRETTVRLVADPGLSMKWIPLRIEVASDTVAIEYGTYAVVYGGPPGNLLDAGRYTNIWHKSNGQWRVTQHALVTSQPVP